jgi:hypothetical protein
MAGSIEKFLSIVHHPLKFRLFLLKKLPSAFFSGVRMKYADQYKTIVTVPLKWFTRNPFNSTYFACLSMAAEMTTGILALANVYEQVPPVSSLVIKTEGSFMKKATGITSFTCEDGLMFQQAVREAASSGKASIVSARSVGTDENGEIVAEFIITWSFKARQI